MSGDDLDFPADEQEQARLDLLADTDPLALRDEAVSLIGRLRQAQVDLAEMQTIAAERSAACSRAETDLAQARAQATALMRIMDNFPDAHMRFGIMGDPRPIEEMPCADWCTACRLERAEADQERLRQVTIERAHLRHLVNDLRDVCGDAVPVANSDGDKGITWRWVVERDTVLSILDRAAAAAAQAPPGDIGPQEWLDRFDRLDAGQRLAAACMFMGDARMVDEYFRMDYKDRLAEAHAVRDRALQVIRYWREAGLASAHRDHDVTGVSLAHACSTILAAFDGGETWQEVARSLSLDPGPMTGGWIDEARRENANAAYWRTRAGRAEIDAVRLRRLLDAAAWVLGTSADDWGDSPGKAWLYGLIAGWDCDGDHDGLCQVADPGGGPFGDDCGGTGAMDAVARRWGWTPQTVQRIRVLHAARKGGTLHPSERMNIARQVAEGDVAGDGSAPGTDPDCSCTAGYAAFNCPVHGWAAQRLRTSVAQILVNLAARWRDRNPRLSRRRHLRGVRHGDARPVRRQVPRSGREAGMSTPYFSDENVSLYLGDCREILPALDLRPDACVADPPYGETANTWDRWPDGWIKTVGDVLPPSASLWCFGSARMFLDHVTDFAGWKYAQEALWVKRNGSGPTSRDRLVKLHEWAYHWYRGKWGDLHHEWERERATTNRGAVRKAARAAEHQRDGRANAWVDDGTRQPRSVSYLIEAPSVRYQKRHPDEKPLAVVAALVRECTPPGGLVLDPFSGGGDDTSGCRAHRPPRGRHRVGRGLCGEDRAAAAATAAGDHMTSRCVRTGPKPHPSNLLLEGHR